MCSSDVAIRGGRARSRRPGFCSHGADCMARRGACRRRARTSLSVASAAWGSRAWEARRGGARPRWSAPRLARRARRGGSPLGRPSRRVQARTALERALDLAHRCGARRIAGRARAELIAAGAKPRRDAITGRDALTPGELRVARLAAEGLANREIAQALFITASTAKGHLNRVYHKLGITRRGELPDALTAPVDDARHASGATATIS